MYSEQTSVSLGGHLPTPAFVAASNPEEYSWLTARDAGLFAPASDVLEAQAKEARAQKRAALKRKMAAPPDTWVDEHAAECLQELEITEPERRADYYRLAYESLLHTLVAISRVEAFVPEVDAVLKLVVNNPAVVAARLDGEVAPALRVAESVSTQTSVLVCGKCGTARHTAASCRSGKSARSA